MIPSLTRNRKAGLPVFRENRPPAEDCGAKSKNFANSRSRFVGDFFTLYDFLKMPSKSS